VTPPTLSSKALLSEKIIQNHQKTQNIAKNVNSCSKVPKIGPNGFFERFLSVFPPYKAKKGSKYTILYHFDQHFFFLQVKNGYPPHPFA
jgi:hypothetical protein